MRGHWMLCLVLLVVAGCGETNDPDATIPDRLNPDGSRPPTADPGSTADGVGASQGDIPKPVRAREFYESRSPAEVLAEAEQAAAQPVAPAPEVDASWSRRAHAALGRAHIDATTTIRAAEVGDVMLDILETTSPEADAVWIAIERGRNASATPALAERAALHTTPVARSGYLVEKITLADLEAYRSNFDDPNHPTLAWVHGGLFVRVGNADLAQARKLHAALTSTEAYDAGIPAPRRASAPAAVEDSPSEPFGVPAKAVQDPLVGRWIVRKTFVFTAQADGTWALSQADSPDVLSSGRWRAENGVYVLGTGRTARIRPDGILALEEGGKVLEGVREPEPGAFGTPNKSEEKPTEPKRRFKPFGERPGLDTPAETRPEEKGTPADDPMPNFGAFASRMRRGDTNPSGKRMRRAVEEALRWLAAHQSPDGRWEAAGFGRWCNGASVPEGPGRADGSGKATYDAGVTGLAICAFLGAGYTSRGKHAYAKTVSKGLRYLKSIQDEFGCFGSPQGNQSIYAHAICSLAMVEAFGMTGSATYKRAALDAVDFIGIARNPGSAWRYGTQPGDNDTSISSWMITVLASAERITDDAIDRGWFTSGVDGDPDAFKGMRAWLNKVTDTDYGRVGYLRRGTGPARPRALVRRFPMEKSEAMTAAGMLARIFMGEDPRKSKLIKLGADLCAKLPPTWNPTDGSIDMYYWYYGSLAMYQVGGKHWEIWKKGLESAVLAHQRKDTDYCRYRGSWDPVGPWGADGGRVYSTAILALCLQAPYRYERMSGDR